MIGKAISIVLTNSVTRNETRFAGIIFEIDLAKGHGFHGEVILSGFSPTILLDIGPNIKSFKGTTLQEIVNKADSLIAGNDLNFSVKPHYTLYYTV